MPAFVALNRMHRSWLRIHLSSACVIAFAGPVLAQQLFHVRGPGELLPPALVAVAAAGPVDADLTVAEFLWAFHRDSMLSERRTAPLAPVTVAAIADGLLAASRDPDPDLRAQSLWALARIVRHDAVLAARLHERILGKGLLRGADALAEVAAVAVGLAAHGDPKVLAALTAIATDRDAAERQRAFAFYGFGLAAQNAAVEAVQFRVLAAVERALLAGSEAPTQVRVAALHALALTRLDVAPKLTGPALALLERAWAEESPPAPIDFAAHVPLAVAAVVPAADPAAETWRQRFAAAATAGRGRSLAVPRSCVLALGAMCRPWQDASSPDAQHGQVLHDIAKQARDQQARNYAWFAIGRAGGAQHRAFLMQGMGESFLVKPWVAFGLAASVASTDAADAELVAMLEALAKAIRHPSVREAVAGSLRIVRRDAPIDLAQDFRERYARLMPGVGEGDARCANLLAVLGDAKAAVADRGAAAVALGHLGDRSPRHWSAALARAIDYRSATPVLLGLPNGVLRLP